MSDPKTQVTKRTPEAAFLAGSISQRHLPQAADPEHVRMPTEPQGTANTNGPLRC